MTPKVKFNPDEQTDERLVNTIATLVYILFGERGLTLFAYECKRVFEKKP